MRTVRPVCPASFSRAQRSRSNAWLAMSSAVNTQPLEDVAPVQRDDASHQIEPLHAFESRLFHHGPERRLVRVHADRFGEIAVTCLVASHELAKARQDIKTVPVVSRLKQRRHF